MAGDTAIIGAPNNGGAGAAYVFVRSGGTWMQQAKLTASDAMPGDEFGYSVSISGDTVVVGSRFADLPAGSDAGAAYVFIKPGGGWVDSTELAKLTASDAMPGDQLGSSVSISSDTIVAGAPHPALLGSAYVFVKPPSGWVNATETAKLTASDAASDDQFGYSASISGDSVVVGSPFDDHVGGADAGSAYVFVRPGGGWSSSTETTKLVASDAAMDCLFGNSISVDGNTVLGGARGRPNGGAAYVFVGSGNTWTQQAILAAADTVAGDFFGFSVALNGNSAAIGAVGDSDAGVASGAAYVFVRSGGFWYERLKITPADAATGLNFGNGVSIASNAIVIGAIGGGVATPNSGSAYLYDLACETSCCAGDMNNDGLRDEADVTEFVNALLNDPQPGTQELCRADINGDNAANGLDICPFMYEYLNGLPCGVADCCPGDADGNGRINGEDIAWFVRFYLDPPPSCSLFYCRCDVDMQFGFNDADIVPFANALLNGVTCGP
jgi:hypothetical protein